MSVYWQKTRVAKFRLWRLFIKFYTGRALLRRFAYGEYFVRKNAYSFVHLCRKRRNSGGY